MIPVLDAGALLALERRRPRMLALVDELVRLRRSAHLPAGVLAQAWRNSPRQHAIARLLATKAVRVDPLDDSLAMHIGALLAVSGTTDVIDAHVALLTRRVRGVALTSDPDDLRALDPTIAIEVV